MRKFMQSFIYIVVVLAVIAIAVGTPTYAAQKEKSAKNGPVILLLDPDGNMLRNGRIDPMDYQGVVHRGGDPGHKSSVIIVEDERGNKLLAEVPGKASEHVLTSRNADGIDMVLDITDENFRRQRDIAVNTFEAAMNRTLLNIILDDCGYTFCLKDPGGIDCWCLNECSDCYHIIVNIADIVN